MTVSPTNHITLPLDAATAGGRVVQRCRYWWGDGHVRAIDLYLIRDGKIAGKLSYVKG